MFDAVRNNQRIVQIILGLITLPFAFWGVDSYIQNAGAGSDVAKVGDTKISFYQFDQALRERQEQMRQRLGARFKAEMGDSPEVRLSVLNGLIDQRLLLLEATKKGVQTGDGVLRDVIARIPALQDNGQFSMERYEAALRAKGMSRAQFEAKLRQDLTQEQLLGSIGETAFVSTAQAETMLRVQLEERQFAEFRLPAEQFADKVKLDADAVRKYYDENKAQFEIPEQIKVEYLVLSLDDVQQRASVSEAEIKTWYESHKERYQQPEERRASHILIMAKTDAGKTAAKAKAEDVLKEVRKTPARFAELAKQYSQDQGSAKNGGDLGYFGRGSMVKAFEEVVFKQKEGEISEVLESDFGYHIVKLTGVRPAKLRSLDEVRADITSEMKRQAATRQFAEAAEAFNNTVFEQADSLQPAADKFKLKIQRSGWLSRSLQPAEMAGLGPLANEKILAALFAEDALKNRRNIEAYEIAPNTLLSARVVEHAPASLKAFDTVKVELEKFLRARQAVDLAVNAGEARLAELKQGGADKLNWSAARSVSRLRARELPPAAAQAVFKADVRKLPAYAGAHLGSAYALYRIDKVTSPETLDENQRKALQTQYGALVAQEDASAYVNSLRKRYKIDVNKSALEGKER